MKRQDGLGGYLANAFLRNLHVFRAEFDPDTPTLLFAADEADRSRPEEWIKDAIILVIS